MGRSGLPAPRSERPSRRPSPADTAAELVTVAASPPLAGGDRLRRVHRPACKGATRPARSADRGCPVAAPGVTEGRPETLRGAAHEVAPRGRHRRDPYLAQRRTSSDSRLCALGQSSRLAARASGRVAAPARGDRCLRRVALATPGAAPRGAVRLDLGRGVRDRAQRAEAVLAFHAQGIPGLPPRENVDRATPANREIRAASQPSGAERRRLRRDQGVDDGRLDPAARGTHEAHDPPRLLIDVDG